MQFVKDILNGCNNVISGLEVCPKLPFFTPRIVHSLHALSNTIVARSPAVYAGQFGSPLWLGLPLRAN